MSQGARRRPGTFALVVLMVVSIGASGGCVKRSGPGGQPSSGAEPEIGLPRPELGQPAADLPPEAAAESLPPETGAAAPGGGSVTTMSAAPSAPPTGAPLATAAPPDASPVVISSSRDPADVNGPAYADLRGLVVERVGSTIRVTVEVGGDVPPTLAEREVIGLGVDFSRSGRSESDVQLFVDGGESGWRAYLQNEDGFVDYQGTFAIGGNRLVFEVPAGALPDPLPEVVSAFLDWSTKTPVPNSSSDALPDEGPLRPTP